MTFDVGIVGPWDATLRSVRSSSSDGKPLSCLSLLRGSEPEAFRSAELITAVADYGCFERVSQAKEGLRLRVDGLRGIHSPSPVVQTIA